MKYNRRILNVASNRMSNSYIYKAWSSWKDYLNTIQFYFNQIFYPSPPPGLELKLI